MSRRDCQPAPALVSGFDQTAFFSSLVSLRLFGFWGFLSITGTPFVVVTVSYGTRACYHVYTYAVKLEKESMEPGSNEMAQLHSDILEYVASQTWDPRNRSRVPSSSGGSSLFAAPSSPDLRSPLCRSQPWRTSSAAARPPPRPQRRTPQPAPTHGRRGSAHPRHRPPGTAQPLPTQAGQQIGARRGGARRGGAPA